MKRTTIVLVFCVAGVTAGHAQTLPKVFSACYAQNTGTTYRIKEPGLPTQCINVKHTEFSWIDGVPGYDHGALNGLADDDHPQYLLAAGTSALAGSLGAGGFKITGLGAGTVAGDAVRFEQTVKVGDAAAGDLSGSYPNPSVVKLQGHGVVGAAPTKGQVLTFDGALWTPTTPPTGVTDHGMLSGLTDDDHPQYLLAEGVRASMNGFAVTGTFSSGGIPATGPGVRLMWYPAQAAFRAGQASGTGWDGSNIGAGSMAFGYATIASGNRATAMGAGGTASGDNSTAMGYSTTASGTHATAMGSNTTASGISSTAMGSATFATGADATAMGAGTLASGDRTTAIGTLASTNSRTGSLVFGDASTLGTTAQIVRANVDNSFVVRAQQVWFGSSGSQPASPAGYFTADGVIASTAGGFRFPDGTVQTSANAGGVTDHGALTGLTDDDHPQYLLADGVRSSTNGFAVGGTFGSGAIPVEGAGTRLLWYPGRAAFRAGQVTDTRWNDASVGEHSVAMGLNTTASGDESTAMGFFNTASGHASIAMGWQTNATATSAVALGFATTASGIGSTAIGLETKASAYAATATGYRTESSGDRSTAMGSYASTNSHLGSFVYGDGSTTDVANVNEDNSFVVRAQRISFGQSGDQITGHYINTSTGAYLTFGGTWTNASDVNRKENFRDENAESALNAIGRLPIRSWNYRAEDSNVRHLGPTAQSFFAAFHLGDNDKAITTVDEGGVALLGIQALEQRTRVQAQELEALRSDNAALHAGLAALRAVLDSLVQKR